MKIKSKNRKTKYSRFKIKAILNYLGSWHSKAHITRHFGYAPDTTNKYVKYLYGRRKLTRQKSNYKSEILYKRR